ncbi:hypothetical protein V865_005870 [Kwoniella europaea PYCC6329]|uniref:Uncharacterized protein n=1 Tax=Kwoniella europaea PYCC6329 TaxID=1423913 RepID=A0AAX4KMQ1_9TREE
MPNSVASRLKDLSIEDSSTQDQAPCAGDAEKVPSMGFTMRGTIIHKHVVCSMTTVNVRKRDAPSGSRSSKDVEKLTYWSGPNPTKIPCKSVANGSNRLEEQIPFFQFLREKTEGSTKFCVSSPYLRRSTEDYL